MNKKKTKIIHVHFFSGHKNYYFASVTAIFIDKTDGFHTQR